MVIFNYKCFNLNVYIVKYLGEVICKGSSLKLVLKYVKIEWIYFF